jgi:hypothetical protein
VIKLRLMSVVRMDRVVARVFLAFCGASHPGTLTIVIIGTRA